MLHNILLVVHVMLALGMVGLILLQQGKGADAGAAFGSGASSTVFGARGSASFLSRTTGLLAALFFITSLSLAYLARQDVKPSSVTDIKQTQVETPASAAASKTTGLPVEAPPPTAAPNNLPVN
ncbi:MAG: preprotein translocase subunit SecG [Gammaproteobacteria bacterium]|nr:preprotein translocase subunit SecG [Gammaproteobacteria bacterium]